jgi:hypothetical protein
MENIRGDGVDGAGEGRPLRQRLGDQGLLRGGGCLDVLRDEKKAASGRAGQDWCREEDWRAQVLKAGTSVMSLRSQRHRAL